MNGAIDWEKLARQLGTLTTEGESGGSDVALRAVEFLLGQKNLRAAVDHYVNGGLGSELTRSVLWLLHPWSAMEHCYEIYRSDADLETKTSAVELLRVVADRRGLPWVAGFLADPNPGIQCWGAGMLDQLLWSHLVLIGECEDLLRTVREHSNEQVRRTGAFIDSYLLSRGANPSKAE